MVVVAVVASRTHGDAASRHHLHRRTFDRKISCTVCTQVAGWPFTFCHLWSASSHMNVLLNNLLLRKTTSPHDYLRPMRLGMASLDGKQARSTETHDSNNRAQEEGPTSFILHVH